MVAGNLDGGKCAVLEGGRGSRNASCAATLAFVPEPQPLTGGLLHHSNISGLLHLVKVAASCKRRASVRGGHWVGGEIARLVTRAQNINCKGVKLDLKITLEIALQFVWECPISASNGLKVSGFLLKADERLMRG